MMLLLSTTLFFTTPAEETLSKMTLDEKIGQLFVIPACPERGEDHLVDLHKLIDEYHIGGILLKQGDQESYRKLYQNLSSSIPLLHIGDAEWGVSMRMKDAVRFPRNLTEGAIVDTGFLKQVGHQVGRECRQVGLHLNLAPVADVNTNPKNPVIGMRSFGDNPFEVGKRVAIFISALQEEKVGACAKHYPGHGDTSVDSHVDLPVVQQLQLEPFEAAIKNHVSAIMTAHLFYQPTGEVVTFSKDLVGKKLRQELNLEGLIVTDALNMGALAKYEQVSLKAYAAGHDLLVYGDHRPDKIDYILRTEVPQAIGQIKEAMAKKEFDEKELDAHVLRILKYKKKYIQELPQSNPLVTAEALALKKTLFQEAVTVVANKNLPFKEGTNLKLRQFGTPSDHFAAAIGRHLTANDIDGEAKTVAAVYEMTEEAKTFIKNEKPDVVVLFTTPYKLLDIDPAPAVIVAYERDSDAEEAVVDILFGKREAKGKLPVKL
jgi:beta-N-acetylhexosaminidase